jgi:predicted DsbA family dithiol-disulfide isomerase
MTDTDQAVQIDYYTDVLCVWAWIAQPRLEELHRQWGSKLTIRHRYVDVFGDCYRKIPDSWGASDGFERFNAHVAKSVEAFDEIDINKDIWAKTRPRSSLQAHLVLKAAELVAGRGAQEKLALRVRQAFFLEARDICDMDILLELASDCLASEQHELQQSISDGRAIAALSDDLRSANNLGVKGSPTWVMNDGRQILYGNVGYRILSANIGELINNPSGGASWC